MRLAVTELSIPHHFPNVATHITASIGIAVLHQGQQEESLSSTIARLLERADIALYEAKCLDATEWLLVTGLHKSAATLKVRNPTMAEFFRSISVNAPPL